MQGNKGQRSSLNLSTFILWPIISFVNDKKSVISVFKYRDQDWYALILDRVTNKGCGSKRCLPHSPQLSSPINLTTMNATPQKYDSVILDEIREFLTSLNVARDVNTQQDIQPKSRQLSGPRRFS